MATDLADLPRAKFDGYAQATPQGEWSYCLDEPQIVFGPGWWPFYRSPHHTAAPVPATVRLSPDTAYRSWRNEYVLVFDDRESSRMCWFGLRIWLRAQGMGGFVWESGHITLDIPTGTWAITGDVPDEVLTEVETKVAKIHTFIHQMRSLRRKGVERPPHAHEAWLARNAAKEEES
jgi:hypothetical protein